MRIALSPRAKVSTQLFYTVKTMSCNSAKLPLLLDDCMDEEGRATHEAVAERGGEMTCMDAGGRAPTVGALGDAGAIAEENKIKYLNPPHPCLLPQGRRSSHFCRYLCVLKRTL